MSGHKKRLIEYDIPLEKISEHSGREKNIRHGHISTLHIWWARRPLASCRAAIYSSLISAPENEKERKEKFTFVADLSSWENSLNQKILEKARRDILNANNGKQAKILDCFAGGGSIPLESLRLGCKTYALEYNPVAILIEKATLEYPQKYGKELLRDVKKWGRWVFEETRKEIGRFYPTEGDPKQETLGKNDGKDWIPVGYLWARTINCQNPDCGAEIPLIRQFWLRKKKGNNGNIDWNDSIYLKPVIDEKNNKVDFEIIKKKRVEGFDPSKGTRSSSRSRGSFTCPICGTSYKPKHLRGYAKKYGFRERIIAVALYNKNVTGKSYRIARKEDVKAFKKAEHTLKEKVQKWRGKFSPIPDQPLPPDGTLGFRVNKYGYKTWGELFNSRQKLALITFIEKVQKAYKNTIRDISDDEYAKAIATYLALIVSRCSDFESNLVRWFNHVENACNTFARQSLSMTWDYFELNPFSPVSQGTFRSMYKQILRALNWLTELDWVSPEEVKLGTATSIAYPDKYFDVIVTDPPYYDNVPYSDLSDFFYVWLKRLVGDLYPDLFATPLTPKTKEIIQEPMRHGKNNKQAKKFYEDMMTKSFKEANRVLKPEGIATIVFAHKSTAAWESLIKSFLDSGFVVKGSWPIHTEMRGRLRAQASAALASSVFFVCRKIAKQDTVYFEDIKNDMKENIRKRLDYFWERDIRGSDFFISSIGPAIEMFGKFKQVKKYSGEKVSISELLQIIEKYVAEYALSKILKSPPGLLEPETRFYLVWRSTYHNNKIPFDDARMLAQALGLEITDYMGKDRLIEKSGRDVKVRNPQERGKKFLEKPLKSRASMIDVMHKAATFWRNGEKEKLNNVLEECSYLDNEYFWMVVQAVSEVLPNGDPEKKMLQGLLAGRKRIEKGPKPTKVTDYM